MDATLLLDACREAGIRLYTGVPDSQLKGLCDALYDRYGASGPEHIVAANEGNAIGLCAGRCAICRTAAWATPSTPLPP